MYKQYIYPHFTKHNFEVNKKVLDELLSLNREKVLDIVNDWTLKYQENKEVSKEMRTQYEIKREKVISLFNELGIPYTKRVVRKNYTPPGSTGFFYKRYTDYIPDKWVHKYILGYVAADCNLTTPEPPFYIPEDLIKLYDKTIQYNKRRQDEEKENNNKLVKAIQILGDNSNNLSQEQIIEKATQIEKDKWLKENYKNGDTVEIDDNYCECGTWYYGESRCSCGNRRITSFVEGEILTGFYLGVEPY